MHYFVQLDPDLHQSKNSKAQNIAMGVRAVDAHNGGVEAPNGAV
jgi:hypothetical protein